MRGRAELHHLKRSICKISQSTTPEGISPWIGRLVQEFLLWLGGSDSLAYVGLPESFPKKVKKLFFWMALVKMCEVNGSSWFAEAQQVHSWQIIWQFDSLLITFYVYKHCRGPDSQLISVYIFIYLHSSSFSLAFSVDCLDIFVFISRV